MDELPTAQSTKPIYIRPQSAAPLAASLYATSSSAIGNNGRPMSATLRKQMREFSFGVSDLILTWNLLEKYISAKSRILRSENASRHVAKSISKRMSHTNYSSLFTATHPIYTADVIIKSSVANPYCIYYCTYINKTPYLEP